MSPKLLNILLVLIPVTLYYGFLSPMYTGDTGLVWTPEQSVPSLKVLNNQYISALSQIEIVEREAKSVSDKYSAIDKDLIVKINKLLPDTIDPVKLRNEIDVIANRSGVAITSANITPYVSGPTTGYYEVSISLNTKYPLFKKLMAEYEKNMRLYIVQSVTISRPKEKEKNGEASLAKIDEEMLNIVFIFRVYNLN